MSNLLVAVDGSEANRAALEWAIAGAELSGQSLSIVFVSEAWQVPGQNPPDVSEQDYLQPVVDRATDAATARLGADRVDTTITHGPPLSVLVNMAENYSGLVVGRRGIGAIRRVLIGSTSIAVAGRSSRPVTIVPQTWDGASAAARPVLIGLDMEEQHDAAVRYAFTEAQTRGVSLQVLQGWRPPPMLGEMDGAQAAYYKEWQEVCLAALRLYIERMGQEFPEVDVAVDQKTGHPVDLLVDGAEEAQLLVLGRDEKARWSGFALGSVARSVLPHCDVPVTVVPA
ncbi:MAG: universal stress protein [Marmoricola sp.]